jgi:hypothetical protein
LPTTAAASRNRHCPKCQGAAAKEWLAERLAELLPVPCSWPCEAPWQKY